MTKEEEKKLAAYIYGLTSIIMKLTDAKDLVDLNVTLDKLCLRIKQKVEKIKRWQ